MADESKTPFIAALQQADAAKISTLLAPPLKVEIDGLKIQKTEGERFTGGKSTPIWKLSFTATRGGRSREMKLVVKWVKLSDPKVEFRRETYNNEKHFYHSASKTVRKYCAIPHLVLDEHTATDVCFVLSDISVDYPLHPDVLTIPQAQTALRWLARFHALFWEADSAGGGFPEGMWPSGDYWGLTKKDNMDALDYVAKSLHSSMKVLKTHSVWDEVKNLGSRLAAAASALDANLRKSKGFVRNRTLIHGDFKTANFFLKEAEDGSSEAAVLDFEMSGPGLAAVDLAYFLLPDLRMNLMDQEMDLLAFYHEALMTELDERGAASDFSLETLRAHYRAARCDYFRYTLGRGWTAVSQGDANLVRQVHQDMTLYDGGKELSAEEYQDAVARAFAA